MVIWGKEWRDKCRGLPGREGMGWDGGNPYPQRQTSWRAKGVSRGIVIKDVGWRVLM